MQPHRVETRIVNLISVQKSHSRASRAESLEHFKPRAPTFLRVRLRPLVSCCNQVGLSGPTGFRKGHKLSG